MKRVSIVGFTTVILGGLAWLAAVPAGPPAAATAEARESVIVQGEDLATVAAAVREVGGEITHELGIIDAVAARLTPAQREQLARCGGVIRFYDDGAVQTAAVKTVQLIASQDTSIAQHKPDDNVGLSTEVKCAADVNQRKRPLIRFDLSSISSAASVTAATLKLYVTSAQSGVTVNLHRLTQDWVEGVGNKTSGADWDHYDDPNPWSVPGGDFEPIAGGSFIPSTASVYHEMDVTALVQQWVNGSAANYGLLLDAVGNGGDIKIHTREKPGFEPVLEVTFTGLGTAGAGGGGGGGSGCKVGGSGSSHPYTDYPTLVEADHLHDEGTTGYGVTIAILDTGHHSNNAIERNTANQDRFLAHYDAVLDQVLTPVTSDDNGHGSHLSGIMVSSDKGTSVNKYNGIAPDADLVAVKAFDSSGFGTYADVIRGLDWIVANRLAYGIRVANLSISAPVRSYYWDDPINQAVMAAWQAGLVVVVSAGNTGPEPMTIGVPANVPYVITVGAMTDDYTPKDGSDDYLASWSAAGPTVEAFVKPEIVAPGGHMVSKLPCTSYIAQTYPEFNVSGQYFSMSGTSQAAALVSGVAALMLQADPTLTNDDLKCRLMYHARPAVDPAGGLAYSVFQQGAGLIDVYAAVYGTMTGCGNPGLDVDADVAGTQHFQGPVEQDEYGNFYLENRAANSEYYWDGTYSVGGFPFVEGYPWIGGFPFVEGYPWIGGFPFVEGFPFTGAYPWMASQSWVGDPYPQSWTTGLTETMGINVWVPQE